MPVVAIFSCFGRDLLALFCKFRSVLLGGFGAGATVRLIGIGTYGVNRAIAADIAGKALQRGNGVFLVEVDNFRALLSRHLQSRLDGVDGKNTARLQQLCAGNGELADRAAAEDY